MAPDILKLAGYLTTAERALANERARGPKPGALLKDAPACAEGCAVCSLVCAVMTSCVSVLREDLEAAMRQQAPALSHGGRFYVATEGRA